jgi:hypothetical protein
MADLLKNVWGGGQKNAPAAQPDSGKLRAVVWTRTFAPIHRLAPTACLLQLWQLGKRLRD